MRFANLSVARKLMLAFGIMVIISMASSALSIARMHHAAEATRWNNHTHEVLAAAAAVGAAMVDQETGVRGFLIAGDERFLEPYEAGAEAYDSAFDRLRTLTSDNAEQQARIAALDVAATAWRDEIADVEIQKMADPATVEEARQMETSQAGKRYMDEIRARLGEIRSTEEALLEMRSAEQHRDEAAAKLTLVLGGAAGVVCAIIMGFLLSRAIAAPLVALQQMMRKLASGDTTVDITGADRKDEVGGMAAAVQVFKEAAIEKVRLERIAAEQAATAEEDRRRQEAAKAEAARQLALVVENLATGLEKLSAGELTYRIEQPFSDEYEKLRTDFNGTVGQLQETMRVVTGNVRLMRSGTGEISQAADDLSRRTEQQAASLEETAAALDEITATVNRTAEGATDARKVVNTAKEDAELSGEVVRNAVAAMSEIEKSAQEISQIIGVIDEIAFQTNLLALNAGVEAARAGDAGRGFAVVASEVRALAQRSAQAAKEIKTLIGASSQQVGSGVHLVGQTGEALERIVGQVSRITAIVNEIAASTQEQATGLHQVNTAVNQMDQVTQQNAAMVEETTAASHSLAQEAEQLSVLVSRFQVGEEAATRLKTLAPASSRPPAPAPKMASTRPGAGVKSKPKLALAGAADSWEEF
ncbi:MAG: methyl-accepting chemotaxis protein [Brevundimonas sp.]